MFIVEEPRLNNIRLTILETSVAITDAEAQLCVADATGPTTNEYHLLVRTGKHFQDLRDEMSLVVTKPIFGVSDQVRYKPSCTATEDG